jgi:exopolysaccharide biosynthesis polyprenyl glycosylphosphotransferase
MAQMLEEAAHSTIPGPAAEAGALHGLRSRAETLTGVGVRSGRAWSAARLSLDASMLFIAAAAATLGSSAAGVPAPPAIWLAVYSGLVLTFTAMRGMYRPRIHHQLLDELRGVLIATSLAGVAVLSLREVVSAPSDLSAQMIRTWALATAYVAAGRVALHWSRAQAYRHGESLRPTLIIGAGKVGRLAAARLLSQPQLGLRPVGFLDKDPLAGEDDALPLPVLGASWDLDHVVSQYRVEQVIVTFSTAPHDVLLRLVKRCEELGVQVAFVPRLFEKVTGNVTVEHLGGLPLITSRAADPKGIQFAIKYALDRLVAFVLLVLALAVMIPAAVGVLLTMGRPLFFKQVRVGRDGRTFAILKFRTMRLAQDDSPAQRFDLPPDTAPGGVEGGDRRTRLGSLLRRTSIDELPQLINVLKGEMSLIGPRPERPEFVDMFEESVYRYGDRHRVKAGITGWAQVHGLRGKTSLSDRVEWDNHYIENWSLWLDVKVVLLTFLAVTRALRHVE